MLISGGEKQKFKENFKKYNIEKSYLLLPIK